MLLRVEAYAQPCLSSTWVPFTTAYFPSSPLPACLVKELSVPGVCSQGKHQGEGPGAACSGSARLVQGG